MQDYPFSPILSHIQQKFAYNGQTTIEFGGTLYNILSIVGINHSQQGSYTEEQVEWKFKGLKVI